MPVRWALRVTPFGGLGLWLGLRNAQQGVEVFVSGRGLFGRRSRGCLASCSFCLCLCRIFLGFALGANLVVAGLALGEGLGLGLLRLVQLGRLLGGLLEGIVLVCG